MDTATCNIIYLLIWFIVPAIPAVVLFKLVPPERTFVKGPFQGLRVDLTGSFAGYFLLVITSSVIIGRLVKFDEPNYEVWTITGKVLDEKGKPIRGQYDPSLVIYPPKTINCLGKFEAQIIGTREEGRIRMSDLYVQAHSYLQEELGNLSYVINQKPAEIGQWKMDYKNHVAELKTPLKVALDLTPPDPSALPASNTLATATNDH